MKPEEKVLIREFKRLIQVLSMGKRTPILYGNTELYRAEVHILEIISDTKAITATDIALDLNVTKGAVSQLINKLFRKGLIKKVSKDGNLKSQELSLTPNGKKVIEAHDKREHALLMQIDTTLKRLRPEDVKGFSAIVRQVTNFCRD